MEPEPHGDDVPAAGALEPFTADEWPDTPSAAENAMAGLLAQRTDERGAADARDARSGAECGSRVHHVPLTERDEVALVEWVAFGLDVYQAEDPPGWSRQKLEQLLPHAGALGDYLEHLPPGERLGTFLAAIDIDAVDDFSLVEVVAAYKRMEAWSAAKAARAAAALAEREALNPTWPGTVPGRTRGECLAGEEIAMRLRTSRLTAVRMAACGRAFGGMFAPTGQALEFGLIDYPRAQAIVRTLEELPSDVAMAAQLEVLDKAPDRTLRQVHQDLAKAVIAVDPDSADVRHRAARTKRCVNRPRPLPDGMASVSAVLPAADAIALDTALDAAARSARNSGDQRTLDQLRADCLALMGHTALETGHIGPHPFTHRSSGSAAQGGSTLPSDDDGACVTPPRVDDGPPFPGHRLPGRRLPTIRLGTLGGGRADVRVTVPLNVLLPGPRDASATAMDREPEPVAQLEGYGPIPPEVARALSAGGVWRRLVTDPTHSHVLNVGRTRYQPPASIADHVRERDGTCVRPGCSRSARSSDLDHDHEWQHGGSTSVENLQVLCRRDHAIKSIGAFTVAHATDRTYAWTTPTGHGYLRRTDGTIVTLPRHTAEGLRTVGQQARRTGRGVDPSVVDAVLAEVAAGTSGATTGVPGGEGAGSGFPRTDLAGTSGASPEATGADIVGTEIVGAEIVGTDSVGTDSVGPDSAGSSAAVSDGAGYAWLAAQQWPSWAEEDPPF